MCLWQRRITDLRELRLRALDQELLAVALKLEAIGCSRMAQPSPTLSGFVRYVSTKGTLALPIWQTCESLL
jgi:hypothetical protein